MVGEDESHCSGEQQREDPEEERQQQDGIRCVEWCRGSVLPTVGGAVHGEGWLQRNPRWYANHGARTVGKLDLSDSFGDEVYQCYSSARASQRLSLPLSVDITGNT